MRIARTTTRWALVTLLLTGCAEAPEAVDPVPVPDDHVGAAAEDDPYTLVVASIEARGAAGAQSAWDGGKPALLLFAASW